MKNKGNKGFTLIEVLVVIGIIAILAAIVVVAVNPARQFAQANNSQRWSNVNAILNAVHQYAVQNRGALPDGITETRKEICRETSIAASTTCGSYVFLGEEILTPNYIVNMPTDPRATSTGMATGYFIEITSTSSGRILVTAPYAELDEEITVQR